MIARNGEGDFRWSIQGARREGKKGRARRTFWMAVKRRLKGREKKLEEEGLG